MVKLVFLLFIVFFLTNCGGKIKEEKKITKSFLTYTVKTGTVQTKNKYIGYTYGIKELLLSAKIPGKISYLAKNVGDNVRKGELLIQLETEEAKSGLLTAKNIIKNLYDLRVETSKSYDGQIGTILAKINQAKVGIKGIKIGIDDTNNITNAQLLTAKSTISQAELAFFTAKIDLNETKNTLESKNKKIVSGAKTSIIQSIILYKNIIDFSDKLLGVTKENKDFNDKFDDYLGTKDSSQLENTKKIFLRTKKIFINFEQYYLKKIEDKKATKNEIIVGLKLAEKAAEAEKILLKNIYTTVDNSIDNIYFPLSLMEQYKNSISSFGSRIESSLLSIEGDMTVGIKGSLENLEDFEVTKNKGLLLLEKKIEVANKSLEIAQKTYSQYVAISSGKINGIKTEKEIAEEKLKEAIEGLKALKAKKQAVLKEIDTKIIEAKGGKNSATIMIDSGDVISNISGIIAMKMAEEGQVVDAGTPIYKILDNSTLKVKTSVGLDVYKGLELNQILDVKIDGIEKSVSGKISMIGKTGNSFTKKYNIEIIINNKNGEIQIGTMAEIQIGNTKLITRKTKNVIIPNEAIISKFMLPGVFVLEKNKVKYKNIKIIKMGEKFSEVDGVKKSEVIITKGKENIWDGEELEKK